MGVSRRFISNRGDRFRVEKNRLTKKIIVFEGMVTRHKGRHGSVSVGLQLRQVSESEGVELNRSSFDILLQPVCENLQDTRR